MVLLTGLDSIIESLYLDERLTEHSRDGNILVNPVSISYVINKVIIINHKYYLLVEHKFDGVNLYYPKPISFYDHYLNGDLTVLGYLMYQLGCDISDVKDDTIFSNLDIIKMNNGFII